MLTYLIRDQVGNILDIICQLMLSLPANGLQRKAKTLLYLVSVMTHCHLVAPCNVKSQEVPWIESPIATLPWSHLFPLPCLCHSLDFSESYFCWVLFVGSNISETIGCMYSDLGLSSLVSVVFQFFSFTLSVPTFTLHLSSTAVCQCLPDLSVSF